VLIKEAVQSVVTISDGSLAVNKRRINDVALINVDDRSMMTTVLPIMNVALTLLRRNVGNDEDDSLVVNERRKNDVALINFDVV
jgi:hypothetical protein